MNGEDRLAEGELSGNAEAEAAVNADPDRTGSAGRPGWEWPRADRTDRSRGQREAEAEAEVATGRLAATLMLGLSVLAVVFAALAVWLMLT